MIQEVAATQLFTRSQMLSILSANVRVTLRCPETKSNNRVNWKGEREVLLTFQPKQEGKDRALLALYKKDDSPQGSDVSRWLLVVTVSYYSIQ